MSLVTHASVLGLLVIDLIFGGTLVHHIAGSWAAIAFEFLIILGYLVLVLQLVPWRKDS
jgi:hypothetical protein